MSRRQDDKINPILSSNIDTLMDTALGLDLVLAKSNLVESVIAEYVQKLNKLAFLISPWVHRPGANDKTAQRAIDDMR